VIAEIVWAEFFNIKLARFIIKEGKCVTQKNALIYSCNLGPGLVLSAKACQFLIPYLPILEKQENAFADEKML
jgi:hypothetical protein